MTNSEFNQHPILEIIQGKSGAALEIWRERSDRSRVVPANFKSRER